MYSKQLGQDVSIDPFAGVATDIGSGTAIWINPDSTFTVFNQDIPLTDPTAQPIIMAQTQPAQQGGDWWTGVNWSTVKDIAGTVLSGAATVIKAIAGQPSGQAVPAGYRYDPVTQRIVPIGATSAASGMPSWLLPVGLLGIGAVLLMKRR